MDIATFNLFFHQPVLHPMVAVGEFMRADASLWEEHEFDMYCILLLDARFGELRKDGRPLPCEAGSIVALKPGQRLEVKLDYSIRPHGWMLAFRPELLVKAGLGRDFYMFDFFDRDFDAALTLSDRERSILAGCFENLLQELLQDPDYLTNHMIRLCIGRLLSCCKRFYERQYSARPALGRRIVPALDAMLDSYLSSGNSSQQGLPNVTWCADQFHLSANYFGTLVKQETHVSAQEYIQEKVIDAARKLLSTTTMPVGEIAEELGFSYPNHFTRLFRQKTGMTPRQYRGQVRNA